MTNNELPDWCRVGKWIWYKDAYNLYGSLHVHGYWLYVTAITDKGIETLQLTYEVPISKCSETHTRPWKFTEAPIGVKCRNKLNNGPLFVAYLNQTGDGYKVIDSETDVDFNAMSSTYIQHDNTPCGVLQHKDELGCWTSYVHGWKRYMELASGHICTKPYSE